MVRGRAYCIDCPKFKAGDPNGECKRFKWLISMALARLDKVCSYDSFKKTFIGEMPGFVSVLTPLKNIAYMTKQAYYQDKKKKGKMDLWTFKDIVN
jgi:hypothetical protein